MSELWKMGAADLAEIIRKKQASCREVIQAHLERIEDVNPGINAITVLLADEALKAADDADQALSSNRDVGPLHGVPMTVKENIDLIGSATTHGIVALKDAYPVETASHIAQLKNAGVIPIGRTNTPDFGSRWHTDNDLRGATKNPWDANCTPGGSSGGDAAALATGMTALGMGNDYAGSLRWPSQCCGITALRPTLGRIVRIPTAPNVPNPPLAIQLFAVHGPMARYARDLRLALHHMSGPDPRDPWWVPAPLIGPETAHPIPVAVTVDPAGIGVDDNVASAVKSAADALSDAGYDVKEVEPPAVARAAQLYYQIILEYGQTIRDVPMEELVSKDQIRFQEAHQEAFGIFVDKISPDCFGERMEIAKAWGEFQAEWPLILGPVAAMQPFPIGFDMAGTDEALAWLRASRLIVIVNMLGLPSVAVPINIAEGLPQGIQVIGRRYREDLCLDAAEAIEDRLGTITPIDPR